MLICLLLFLNFRSLVDMGRGQCDPGGSNRGHLTLWATGTAFSVSAAIGLVARFGIAAMDGIIVLTSYNSFMERGMDRSVSILRTCQIQMRPV